MAYCWMVWKGSSGELLQGGSRMICAKCKRPITRLEIYYFAPGVGDIHYQCPPDPQASLMAEDDSLPIDHIPETYPD